MRHRPHRFYRVSLWMAFTDLKILLNPLSINVSGSMETSKTRSTLSKGLSWRTCSSITVGKRAKCSLGSNHFLSKSRNQLCSVAYDSHFRVEVPLYGRNPSLRAWYQNWKLTPEQVGMRATQELCHRCHNPKQHDRRLWYLGLWLRPGREKRRGHLHWYL